ncbi:MAG: (d)CMP kinase [Lachnospiraceae bacterium]|nr:(d)CMP kinase [Lachnospiraceae bacterium]
MAFNIAIDGPAGAGKSTIAKRVSGELGFVYVDTGAMYRAIGLYCVMNNIDISDESAVVGELENIDVDLKYIDGVQCVLLNGENVNGLIRTEEVSRAASVVSGYAPVRTYLVSKQQQIAKNTDLLMDGRDIGTVVLPEAPLKIYLTASSEERGKRRYLQLREKGEECDLAEIIKDIEERDYRDMHRENSPLKQADDAVLIDSSFMTIDEVVAEILRLVEERR